MAGQSYSTNLGLDVLPVSTDPDNLPDINRLYNAVKALAYNLDAATGVVSKPSDDWSTAGFSFLRLQNSCRLYVKFTEAVIPGNLVSLYNNAGELAAQKAGGVFLAGGLARGFVLSSVAVGEYGEVFLKGLNNMIAGMTPGQAYDLSDTTAGVLTAVGATSPYKQPCGFAVDTNAFWFDPLLYAI